jgi:hypothetical protein
LNIKYNSETIFKENGTDKVYCAIKNEINPRCREAKILVERLWGKAHNYIDSDALEELPTQFHQRFWEIYLAASLLSAGLKLEYSSGRDGPDICIKASNGSKIWVEAVTASSGLGNDAVQQAEPGTARSIPDDQIKLRLLNAFVEKNKKLNHYRERDWVCAEQPYIIAINAAQISSAIHELEVPRIVRSLLPFGYQVLHLSMENLSLNENSYQYQGEITKVSGTKIETDLFLNPEYSGISAVIYSYTDAFNCPTDIGKELLLFHNPLAANPLPLGFLKKGCEYWADAHLKSKSWN